MDPYSKGLPCLNPHCKSHGKPHPNCRCYSGGENFAEGGEVGFCSEAREHNHDCEYHLADGGEVPKFDDLPGRAPKEKVPSFDDIPVSGQKVAAPTAEPVPSFENIPTEGVPEAAPPVAPEKPTDYVELAKAAAEGLAQGFGTDLAKVAEIKLGISTPEAIEQREKDYPLTHVASKGAGFVGALAAGPARLLAAKAGSTILKQLAGNLAIAGAYKSADNITKSLLGEEVDPKETVASSVLDAGLDALMYTATDGLFSATKAAKVLQDGKWVKGAEDAMISLADKPVTTALSGAAAHYYPEAAGHIPGVIGESVKHLGGAYGNNLLGGALETAAIKKFLGPYIEKVIGKPLTKANQYVGDAILNQLIKTDYFAVPTAIRFAQRVAAGTSKLNPAIEGLFKSAGHTVHELATEENKKAISDWVENGGTDKELVEDNQSAMGFADGGEVGSPAPKHAFATAYPVQNIMLNQIRGRAYGYLNSIRPQKNESKLPFDAPTPQKIKEKEYSKALGFAAKPLSILNHVSKGDLTPGDLTHFTQMYPEVYQHISAQMTKKITEAQLKGEKPSYKKRQAMSLFLGVNLDSTFTPQAISTIQGIYAMKKQSQQAAPPAAKTKTLSKAAPSYLTDAQARTQREQNQKA